MKPACWEACFLYPCPTVEHSNNCLLLLCRLFLKPSGHYTNNPYKLKSGQIVCTYRDAGYLQGIIDVSGFSTYKVLVTFDGDSDGFGTENPIPFVINNIVYARSTNRNFNTGSSIAFNYLVIGK